MLKLTVSHKHAIVRALYRSKESNTEERKKWLDAVTEGDKSDLVEQLKATCDALEPSAENKERIWNILVNDKDTSLYIKNAMISGFYSRS